MPNCVNCGAPPVGDTCRYCGSPANQIERLADSVEFALAENAFAASHFDNGRIEYAAHLATRGVPLTAGQIRVLMTYCHFDNGKIAVARYLATNCPRPLLLLEAADVMHFDSGREALFELASSAAGGSSRSSLRGPQDADHSEENETWAMAVVVVGSLVAVAVLWMILCR